MERKLAAILAADVVGYSTLMERDEAGTFDRLKAGRKELFEPEIEKHHGRIFKLMGDGLLAEFGSVVDAVECAVSLQRGLAERNAHVPDDEHIQVRIGINLGEVIVEGDDRYGEGVNVAARLEQLADPGGICVSGKVAREVEKKLAFGFESMGDQQVKNIAEPVPAYRVVLDGAVSPKRHTFVRAAQPRYLLAGALLLIAIVGFGGWYGWLRPGAGAGSSGPREIATLAVLPFVNLSGDPAQDYFGQGLAEDIITALSNLPTIRVMSRTSSFVYDKPVKVQQVGKELGVDYVLEGSVKKSSDQVRVTAQLINAKSGEHVWASRFDEAGADPVALQEKIAERIYAAVGGFGGEIGQSEYAAAARESPTDLEEYDYYLRGHSLWYRDAPGDNAKARAIWEEGLATFPDSTLLRIKVAVSLYRDLIREQSDDPGRAVDRGWKLLEEARADDNRSRLEELLLHWMSAWFYQFHDGDFAKSAREAEAAVKLIPYDAMAYADLSSAMYNAGQTDRAIEWGQEAVRRDPHAPDWYHGNLATAYYLAGKPKEALAEIEKMGEPWTYLKAAVYVRLGRMEEGRAVIAEHLKKCPDCSIKREAVWPGGKQPQMTEAVLKPYLDDLREVGLPEG